MQNQTADQLNKLQREINFRESEITKLKSEINNKEQAFSAASVGEQVVTERKNLLENQLSNKTSLVAKLEDDLTKAHGEIDRVVLGRRAEGTALMQAEAYRQENARLLGMLAKTKEYSNFAQLALDSGESGVRNSRVQRGEFGVRNGCLLEA